MSPWKERTPEFYQFAKKGQAREGAYLGSETIDIDGSPTLRHSMDTKEGLISFLGGVQLDGLLAKVAIGEVCRLEFVGLVKTRGGTSVKTFKLFLWEEDDE